MDRLLKYCVSFFLIAVFVGSITTRYISADGQRDYYSYPKQEALDEYWDDIKEFIPITETLEACSDTSGNCYTLDADINNGNIETLYFDNGGYLNFAADIDSDGHASDIDDEGNVWEFQLDESTIDSAIDDWANYYSYYVY